MVDPRNIAGNAEEEEEEEEEEEAYFCRSGHASDLEIGNLVAILPGVIGSVLGLVGPVAVYCDWVR